MKWIIIGFAAYLLLRILFWLPIWVIKQHKLRQIRKFNKTKCLGVFSKKTVLKVQEMLKDNENAEELKKQASKAASIVSWYWDDGFETCSIEELNCVIFHKIFKNLTEQKSKTADR